LVRLADLVPPPRKNRHRYHGVFAPNHKLRRAVTPLAVGNIGFSPRSRCRWACGQCACHGLLRHSGEAPVARHLPDCVGETPGPGRRGVPARVPKLRGRHPADRLHHQAGADPQDPHAPGRTVRTATDLARPWPAHRLGRARASPLLTATSFRRHPTSCPRSTSAASEPCRGRGHNQAVRPPASERIRADTTKTSLLGERRAIPEPLSGQGQAREA
jgi:hypothetical protein